MFATYIASLVLVGLSGMLIDSHRRSWHAARNNDQLAGHERRFARSQYFRRVQASGVIGIIGLAIGVKPLIPLEPLSMAFYLASLIGACICIMLLAMLDIWATRQHHRRLTHDRLAAELQLVAKLRRATESPEPESPSS